MKENAPREQRGGRKAAAVPAPGAPAGPQPADALQHSPVLATQRRRMAQLLEKGRKPLQRVKSKPTDDALKELVKDLVSAAEGSCSGETRAVFARLKAHADPGDVQAVLLHWAENAGTAQFSMGDHTAAVVTWAEGTYVVDTTISQFEGGPEIFIGSVDAWIDLVTGLQAKKHHISHVSHQMLGEPMREATMYTTTQQMALKVKNGSQPQHDGKEGRHGRKCFLTSACVEFRGLPDDCHELTVLRAFRDGWMLAQPEGPALIDEYYAIAPALVDAIDASPRRAAFYARIFTAVQGCVEHVERGRMRPALDAYVAMVRALQSALPGANAIQGEVHVP